MTDREDRPTSTQYEQARQILTPSLFTPAERRDWLLRMTGATRGEARFIVADLAAEYRRRVKAAA
jgi:hypothetical protein